MYYSIWKPFHPKNQGFLHYAWVFTVHVVSINVPSITKAMIRTNLHCITNHMSLSIVVAMCELGVESVDTLFLALPEMPPEDSLEVLKEFWEVRL